MDPNSNLLQKRALGVLYQIVLYAKLRQITKSSAPSAVFWRRLRDTDYRAVPLVKNRNKICTTRRTLVGKKADITILSVSVISAVRTIALDRTF